MQSSGRISTSTNLFSSEGTSSSRESHEQARERRLHAAMARLQNSANANSNEEPSSQLSQGTPLQQPRVVPAAVTQEESSESREQQNSANGMTAGSPANAVQLQFDDNDSAANDETQESLITVYTEKEREWDAEVEEYRDAISQEFATIDPVDFAGHIYERANIEQFLESQGLVFTNPDHYIGIDGVTSVRDPFGTIVELDMEASRPYTEVHERLRTSIRQEVQEYEARGNRRNEYEKAIRQQQAKSSRR